MPIKSYICFLSNGQSWQHMLDLKLVILIILITRANSNYSLAQSIMDFCYGTFCCCVSCYLNMVWETFVSNMRTM